METLLIYSIKVNSLLLLLWFIYCVFLKNETFYTLNRWYFLSSIFTSFTVPLLFLKKTIWIDAIEINEAVENINTTESLKSTNTSFTDFFVVFIAFVSLLLVVNTLINIIRLYINISKYKVNEAVKISPKPNTVFSFYRWIVVSADILHTKDVDLILAHEQIHITKKHSFDLMIAEIICNIFWFNPLLKLLQKDINLNLEFEVDSLIITQENSSRYQHCLLQTQLQKQALITSTFNSSHLKQRIIHINTKKSKTMKKLKLLFSIPVLVLFFSLFQIKTVAQITHPIPSLKTNPIVTDTIQAIYVLDGKQINEIEAKQLKSKDIKSIKVLKNKAAISKYGEKATNGAIEIYTDTITDKNKTVILKKANDTSTQKTVIEKSVSESNSSISTPLYIVDNIEITKSELDKIDVNTIGNISILKDESASNKYGEKGKYGVIEIQTKQIIKGNADDVTKHNEKIEIKKQTELERQKLTKNNRENDNSNSKKGTIIAIKKQAELERQKNLKQ